MAIMCHNQLATLHTLHTTNRFEGGGCEEGVSGTRRTDPLDTARLVTLEYIHRVNRLGRYPQFQIAVIIISNLHELTHTNGRERERN